jgi:SAM-dependent methyltransferase
VRVDPTREEAELRDYLGPAFDLGLLQVYEQTLDREWEGCRDEATFYRTSEAYLYNLTAFAMTGTKQPYLETLTRLVPPPARVLDYGCGIGSDGLTLIEAGYDVEFADFDNPSVEYLRWRLRRRGFTAPIHDLDREVPGGFDAAYSFDVIEHVPDPHAFLGELERRAKLIVVNLLEGEADDRPYHHDLPIGEILERASAQDLREYRIHHEISHLIAYSPGQPDRKTRLRARCLRAREGLRRRLIRLRGAIRLGR